MALSSSAQVSNYFKEHAIIAAVILRRNCNRFLQILLYFFFLYNLKYKNSSDSYIQHLFFYAMKCIHASHVLTTVMNSNYTL